ncbi:MAG: GNAT family N-acetyltransferase [Oscillospiraceae bacterium]|nr:GNAT family N-acetyltransferase [Oscillospiraceae bacterium]
MKHVTYAILPIAAAHRAVVDTHIAEHWGGPFMVSRGVLHDTRSQPGFVAVSDDEILGYALYDLASDGCGITVLQSLRPNQGVGRALINAVVRAAQDATCKRVWLVTTNDNTHAIRFYQRAGFALRAVHINAMEQAQTANPTAGRG